MHSDVRDFELTAPASLDDALHRLAAEPGRHTPLAGGTELMVALNTGRLAARSFLSIQHLRELRFLRVEPEAIHIGAGSTFTDLRRSQAIQTDLPLLAQAASWTGSVANQNRGTLGGNLCNASPAADAPPALLVYDAAVKLVSATGTRTLPYRDFHIGYKQTQLQPQELLHSVIIPRQYSSWKQSIRKVGTRNAQAISKTALAAAARLEGETIAEIRVAAASLADRPLRLTATEDALHGASINPVHIDETFRLVRAALAREARPIDDIRSTARYRTTVAANLLEEFLRALVPG